jgi:hypothetical protein
VRVGRSPIALVWTAFFVLGGVSFELRLLCTN